MKFYMTDTGYSQEAHGTLAEAHKDAKDCGHRAEVRITQREVTTDHAGIVAILNRTHSSLTNREWKLSARGGLVEVEVGTDKPLKGVL